MRELPLESFYFFKLDIKILDFSRLYPGPLSTMLLKDLGAMVIKVEDKSGGDLLRYYPPLCIKYLIFST
jgi:crotonobetainyl-CoA:carnitine CoA-transferase CaiB-like acyl-CoA transferase